VLRGRPKAFHPQALQRPGLRSWDRRRGALRPAARAERPRHGRGEPQGGENPREPGRMKSGEDPAHLPQPPEGQPLKRDRGRRKPNAPATVFKRTFGPAWPIARGAVSAERRRRPLSGQALKGAGPRERAWLKGLPGRPVGRKAPRRMVSVRAQRDPGRQPGIGGSAGWIAFGGPKPQESSHDGARHLGQTLKRGASLRKARRVDVTACLTREDREVG